ncbi:MAG TPA: CBS domain-containing protein [Candidatus Bathyarchaeia archaeon]|nr:CBS domain-containing protein [Candidatus Bathyarchaeia archaeon]
MKLFVFLSEILENKVVDRDGKCIGVLCDVAMRVNGEVYPRASGLVVRRGLLSKEYAYVEFDKVLSIEGGFKLNVAGGEIVFSKRRWHNEFTLCYDVLDRQVVDMDNQKVVRVNDVHLLRVDNHFYLAHVDVGMRGLIRRLEWSPVIDWIIRWVYPKSSYLNRDDFIPWKNTQVLASGRVKNVLRLDVARQKLAQIPSADLADIMEDLDIFEKHSLFKSMDIKTQRKVFTDLATQEKQDLVDQLTDQEAADLLENIPADEATDLLSSLPKDKMLRLTRQMESETAKELRKLLGFAKDSAGGLMTTEYLHVAKDATVGDALKLIKDNLNFVGNVYYLYVVDEAHKLIGSTALRRFINTDPQTPIMNVCYPKNIFVRTDDGMEEIALLLEKYKIPAIPVVDDKGVLQGVITTDDVMEELISLAWSKYKDKLI